MMDGCGCVTLAQTESGHVRLCRAGCVHVTFGLVTLHFESSDAFEGMAELVAAEETARRPDEGLSVTYHWFSIDLDAGRSHAFASLVASAAFAVAWTRGDLQFSDEDFTRLLQDHPEAA